MFELEDTINLLCALIFLGGLRLTDRLDNLAFGVFLLRTAAVFLTNDVLFPVSYMPDQVGYVKCSMLWRGLDDGGWCVQRTSANVKTASAILGSFPLPFIISVRSLGLINIQLVVLFYLWLEQKRFLSPASKVFFLLYPSFALYSALAMRDTLIFIFMFFVLYQWFEGRWRWLALAWLWPLMLIKSQNALLAAVPILFQLVAGESRKRLIAATSVAFVGGIVGLLKLGMLEELNKHRRSFYAEDGGIGSPPLLTADLSLPFSFLNGALGFLLNPLPWAAGMGFQFIQSLENIFMLGLCVVWWRRKPLPHHTNNFVALKVFMVASFVLYGIVIFNYGTAARYRFPFVLLFILFADHMTEPRPKKVDAA